MQFHVLSFEGPDSYARVGGLETRVTGLVKALAGMDFDAHLWFVGDPNLPGHESQENFHLHRWCQWISGYFPKGVYDGEKAKVNDFSSSLPPFLLNEQLLPGLTKHVFATVIAEEWHTVNAVLHLDWLLKRANLRDRVSIFWNAINLQTHVDPDTRRVLFRAADTVLANSSHEPFGLVGLEAMAVGGIACTGCSGEDYAVSGRNALVLQTGEAQEFIGLYQQLHDKPGQIPAMRRAGRSTAKQYAWPEVIRTNLLPRVALSQLH